MSDSYLVPHLTFSFLMPLGVYNYLFNILYMFFFLILLSSLDHLFNDGPSKSFIKSSHIYKLVWRVRSCFIVYSIYMFSMYIVQGYYNLRFSLYFFCSYSNFQFVNCHFRLTCFILIQSWKRAINIGKDRIIG